MTGLKARGAFVRSITLASIIVAASMIAIGPGTVAGPIGIDRQVEEILRALGPVGPLAFESNFTEYMSYDEMTAYLKAIRASQPALMDLFSIGTTYEGREIWCVKLSDNPRTEDDGSKGSEPDALIVGAHHGNEWISYEVPLYLISFLLESYGQPGRNGSAATYLLDRRELFIIPMLNPDGTQYTLASGSSWRKNREPNYPGDFIPIDGSESELRPTSYGVDLNRNYGWMWHLSGGSNEINQRGSGYRGPPDNHDDDGDSTLPIDWKTGRIDFGPEDGIDEDPWDGLDNDNDGDIDEDPMGGFTSKETIALRGLGDKYKFPVAITFHSFSELVLWPWGYTSEPTSDGPLLTTLGTRMAELNGYAPMQGYDLYMTSGEMTDWFYAVYGTLGYTVELAQEYRPDDILTHCRKNLWSSLYLCHAAANPDESFISFPANFSATYLPGGGMGFEVSLVDTGYPIPLDEGGCRLYYRSPGEEWRNSMLTPTGSGNWSASVRDLSSEGMIEFYFSFLDTDGREVTEPLYAPYETFTLELGGRVSSGLTFGWDTFIVMVLTLGTVWGGFSSGIARSIRADRRRSGAIEL